MGLTIPLSGLHGCCFGKLLVIIALPSVWVNRQGGDCCQMQLMNQWEPPARAHTLFINYLENLRSDRPEDFYYVLPVSVGIGG